MARKTTWPPPVKSERGVDVIRVQMGGVRRFYTLGPTGSTEARAEYLRVVAEVEASRSQASRGNAAVAEVLLAFLDRCEAEVSPGQVARVGVAIAPAARLYGHLPAARFGPVALEVCRREFVAAGRCRRQCNQLTSLIRQCFKWAASRELVPLAAYQSLATLAPLLEGRTEAADRPRVLPAVQADVDATIPHLPPAVADMVRLQLLTGARPGEVCRMHPDAIERPGIVVDGVPVWVFRLGKDHKTAWKGGRRAVAIGPKAQAVLLPYLGRDGYCFCPAEVTRRWLAERGRSTRRGGSRQPGERYTTQSYGRCIASACVRAGVPPWAPNRLRHSAGTRIRAEGTREDARCVLGHAGPDVTDIYAELIDRAARVAARDG